MRRSEDQLQRSQLKSRIKELERAGRWEEALHLTAELQTREAEALMQRERLPTLDTTSRSIEEIATTILHKAGLQRHIF